jgi:hypothetical protein
MLFLGKMFTTTAATTSVILYFRPIAYFSAGVILSVIPQYKAR